MFDLSVRMASLGQLFEHRLEESCSIYVDEPVLY